MTSPFDIPTFLTIPVDKGVSMTRPFRAKMDPVKPAKVADGPVTPPAQHSWKVAEYKHSPAMKAQLARAREHQPPLKSIFTTDVKP